MPGVVVLNAALRILASPPANGETSAGWTAAQTATLIAAIIAGLIALIGTGATFYTAKKQSERDKRDKDITFRRQQLNELYGPVYMLRLASKSIWDALRNRMGVTAPPEKTRWALVDNIEEIHGKGDSFAILAVTNILNVNKQIEDILRGKFGLLYEESAPDSFNTFIAHSQQLQLAWERQINLPEENRISFPRDFDKVIKKDLDAIRAEITKLDAEKRVPSKLRFVALAKLWEHVKPSARSKWADGSPAANTEAEKRLHILVFATNRAKAIAVDTYRDLEDSQFVVLSQSLSEPAAFDDARAMVVMRASDGSIISVQIWDGGLRHTITRSFPE